MNAPEPLCPGCGHSPHLLLGAGTQAFCGNDECHVFFWDPTKTLDELVADAHYFEAPALGDE